MADSRSKNASRNIVFAFANKTVTLLLPFISRTIILYLMGEEFLGIGSLFTAVLSFLSLTELGVGSAIVYAMYEPIARGDRTKICALLSYYKKIYQRIGFAMLGIGTVLLPFIPYLIKGEPPAGANAYVLFYLYLINSVVSYFFAGYKQSLLSAHQRSDVISKIAMATTVFVQMMQILVIVVFRNFYVYAFVPILGTLLTNVLNLVMTNRMYPELVCAGEPEEADRKAIEKRLSGLIGTKLNSIVVHSADMMVVSAFLGLTATAVYSNYYYVINAVYAFLQLFFSSLTAGVGNSLITETKEKNYRLYRKISFINAWFTGWCCVCLLCLMHPFMSLWAGEDLTYPLGIEAMLVLYFFVYTIQRTMLVFKDAAGIWYEDRFRPYVCMILNLFLNIVLVTRIGIYGVVGSSVAAFLISIPWVSTTMFRALFRKGNWQNLLSIGYYAVVTTAVSALTYWLVAPLPGGVAGIAMRLGVCVIVPNLLFLVCYGFKPEFREVLHMLSARVRRRK
ncbi:MAG: lipopolysaccharide biosynthesis protein [Lachnospiraceae bacterium]|nr:lipopolysaccharide biosynthesis protein [Lachnospiraceae bacterium]